MNFQIQFALNNTSRRETINFKGERDLRSQAGFEMLANPSYGYFTQRKV